MRSRRPTGTSAARSERAYDKNGDWGIDGKIGVTSSATLDLTYNTDFAQVEVDEQQINLTRFNLLFPEKRPILSREPRLVRGRPSPGRSTCSSAGGSASTRTARCLPIQGGARLTGKAGGVNIGLLNMQTESVGASPGNNFTAAAVNKDLRNRSSLGAMFVNREGTGSLAGDHNYNRTYSVDGKLGVRQAVTLSAFAARTETPGLSEDDYAYSSAVEFRDANLGDDAQLRGGRRQLQPRSRLPGTPRWLSAGQHVAAPARPDGRLGEARTA
jgi:hypothetical protein